MLTPVRALLDANVLHSNHLRNLLLQLAQNDVFDARRSELIEEKRLRNPEPSIRNRVASNTIPLIRTWFTEALVSGFDAERVIGVTDPKDRHVASAAAAISPCVLVTENLKHFDLVRGPACWTNSNRGLLPPFTITDLRITGYVTIGPR
jgi:hypothetical protein